MLDVCLDSGKVLLKRGHSDSLLADDSRGGRHGLTALVRNQGRRDLVRGGVNGRPLGAGRHLGIVAKHDVGVLAVRFLGAAHVGLLHGPTANSKDGRVNNSFEAMGYLPFDILVALLEFVVGFVRVEHRIRQLLFSLVERLNVLLQFGVGGIDSHHLDPEASIFELICLSLGQGLRLLLPHHGLLLLLGALVVDSDVAGEAFRMRASRLRQRVAIQTFAEDGPEATVLDLGETPPSLAVAAHVGALLEVAHVVAVVKLGHLFLVRGMVLAQAACADLPVGCFVARSALRVINLLFHSELQGLLLGILLVRDFKLGLELVDHVVEGVDRAILSLNRNHVLIVGIDIKIVPVLRADHIV